MSKVTNNGFHYRGRNEAFHKLRISTGFVKIGHMYDSTMRLNKLTKHP